MTTVVPVRAFSISLLVFLLLHGVLVWFGFGYALSLESRAMITVSAVTQVAGLLIATFLTGMAFRRFTLVPMIGAIKFKLLGGIIILSVLETTTVLLHKSYLPFPDVLLMSVSWYLTVGGFVALAGLVIANRVMVNLVKANLVKANKVARLR